MRLIVLALCMFAAACGDQMPIAPTPSASARSALTETPLSKGAHLPFSGSFTTKTKGEETFPILTITGTAEGTATHLGRFTAKIAEVVDMLTATGKGTFDFTAANGDQLFTTTSGAEDQFIPPDTSHVTMVATIVGGTGRFAGATGTFTIRRVDKIDFVAGEATGTGSFVEGHISLGK